MSNARPGGRRDSQARHGSNVCYGSESGYSNASDRYPRSDLAGSASWSAADRYGRSPRPAEPEPYAEHGGYDAGYDGYSERDAYQGYDGQAERDAYAGDDGHAERDGYGRGGSDGSDRYRSPSGPEGPEYWSEDDLYSEPDDRGGPNRSGRSRRLSMLGSTLAVAAVVGALFVGMRLLGASGGPDDGATRRDIGSPALLGLDANGAPIQLDSRQRPVVPVTSSTITPQAPPTPPAPPPPATTTTAPPTTQSKSTAKPTTAKPVTTATGAEAQVMELVNIERANAGCAAVTGNDLLTKAAREHSADMAQRDYFSHDTPEGVTVGTRITNVGYTWSTVGENIAWGQADAQAVMKDWMNSAGHKANILNCSFRNLGVGLAYRSDNRPYWTQDFGTAR